MKHAVIWKETGRPNFLDQIEGDELFRRLVDQAGNVYFITSTARLWSMLKQRYLKGLKRQVNTQFYCQFMLSDHLWRSTHHLVMQAFGPPKPGPEYEVDHMNGDGSNNRLDNLQWVTHQRNIQLSYERGRTIVRGSAHWRYGKVVTEETRARMSLAKKGAHHPKFRGYYLVSGQRVETSTEAAKILGVGNRTAANWCKLGLYGCGFEPAGT